MTPWERQSTGGVTTPPAGLPVAPDDRPSVGAAPRSAAASCGCVPVWEDLFHTATPTQQAAWLHQAEREGLVYAPARAEPTLDRRRQLLHELLAGQAERLDALRTPPLAASGLADPSASNAQPGEDLLDADQREAVARALASPDLCLVQGRPGTGKSRVVREVLARAAACGQRVLLAAPTAAGIDHHLAAAAGAGLALRLLAADEREEDLPAPVRELTLAGRARDFEERALGRARRQAAEAEAVLAARQARPGVYDRLEELAARRELLENELASVRRDRADLRRRVEEGARDERGGGNGVLAEIRQGIADALTEADLQAAARTAARDEAAGKCRVLEERREELGLLVAARDRWQLYRRAWWQSWKRADLRASFDRLQQQWAEARADLEASEQAVRAAEAERLALAQRAVAAEAAWVETEMHRRGAELDARAAEIEAACRQSEQVWQATCRELGPDGIRPEGATVAAVRQARRGHEHLLRQDEARLAQARHQAQALTEVAANLAAHLLPRAVLVGAPTAALTGEHVFGPDVHDGMANGGMANGGMANGGMANGGAVNGAGRPPLFDLLVLEQAHDVTESEFLAVARWARRWLLVGEPSVPAAAAAQAASAAAGPGRLASRAAPARLLRPAGLRPGFFQRLWEALHCDPRQLPYRWTRERGRLCCRLRPVPEAERGTLTREPVVDRPDVELRIATPAGRPSYLAELVFPEGMSLLEAKAYVFRELAEAAVHGPGPSLRWAEEQGRLLLRLAGEPLSNPQPVELGDGVREMVGDAARADEGVPAGPSELPWQTCCIEFDRAAGWGWDKAEEWALEHLGVRDLGRTVPLRRPHRMTAGLARVLGDLLYGGGFGDAGTTAAAEVGVPAVEFIPVPATAAAAASNGSRHVAREGAGLETDLREGRRGDRLPGDLRRLLPSAGLVNYFEATAVVRLLERLTADGQPGTVAVVALYPAQAQLIRVLAGAVPALAGRVPRVDVPGAFREEEFDTVLVSLTRSHAHRVVTLGDGPRELELAVTRARRRLVLLGDPGTLARRAGWEGPVDHLDEEAAAREKRWAARVLGYVQGRGRHADAFRVRDLDAPP